MVLVVTDTVQAALRALHLPPGVSDLVTHDRGVSGDPSRLSQVEEACLGVVQVFRLPFRHPVVDDQRDSQVIRRGVLLEVSQGSACPGETAHGRSGPMLCWTRQCRRGEPTVGYLQGNVPEKAAAVRPDRVEQGYHNYDTVAVAKPEVVAAVKVIGDLAADLLTEAHHLPTLLLGGNQPPCVLGPGILLRPLLRGPELEEIVGDVEQVSVDLETDLDGTVIGEAQGLLLLGLLMKMVSTHALCVYQSAGCWSCATHKVSCELAFAIELLVFPLWFRILLAACDPGSSVPGGSMLSLHHDGST